MLRAALIRIIYTVILFLAGLVLSNLALPEKFGIISLLILNASLLIIVTGFGTDSMVLYKVSNKEWTSQQAFHFIWRGLFLQILFFAVLELGSLLIFKKTLLSSQGSEYLIIDAAYFIGLLIVEKYLSLYYSMDRPKSFNIILTTVAVFYLLLLLLFYYLVKVEFKYVLYVFAFQSLAQGLALIVLFRPGDYRNTRFENKEFLSALKVSVVVMITNVIQLLAYRVDFWLLNYFYSNYEVGLYAQANKFANLSWVIPNIFAQLLIPKFAVMDRDRIREVFSTAFYFNFLLLLATILCAGVFYFFYLRPEYRSGLPAFYLMLPGYFFWGSVIYFASCFSGLGKFSYNLMASSFCFVIILVTDFILIPVYGINGAAIANTIAYSLVFFLYLFFLRKRFSFHLQDLLLVRKNAFSNILKLVGK
jgi:O-antigen/teichoic acid export membrane protein